MSLNSDFDGTVSVQPRIAELEPVPPEPPRLTGPAITVEPAVQTERTPAPETHLSRDVPAASRTRPRWMVPAAVAAVGLIASGTLGYLLFATTGQRDAARHQLATTQTTLATTKGQLSAAQSDAAAKKVTADYVRMFVANEGAVLTDYENNVACTTYSVCRTAAQQLLADLQAFQQARSSALVPAAASNSDGMLGDALSAAIAGTQELISGMDTDNLTKIKDGGAKVDASMLSVAKAEAALGIGLR